jgi:hypothetical protein
MQPLLHRITWDPVFGKGEFARGSEDRVAREKKIVPFASTRIDPKWPDTFSFDDEEGIVAHIRLHRVRGTRMASSSGGAPRGQPPSGVRFER